MTNGKCFCFCCLLLTAHCLLPSAFCLLPTAHCPTAHCLLTRSLIVQAPSAKRGFQCKASADSPAISVGTPIAEDSPASNHQPAFQSYWNEGRTDEKPTQQTNQPHGTFTGRTRCDCLLRCLRPPGRQVSADDTITRGITNKHRHPSCQSFARDVAFAVRSQQNERREVARWTVLKCQST